MKYYLKNPVILFFLNTLAIITAYYVSILLHEWGHGTLAWMNGLKKSPFDIQYGGWLLLNADEKVPYTYLIHSGRGVAAALIGIAGVCVSIAFVILCFNLLNCKKVRSSPVRFIFSYWFLAINMIPLVQYFTISTFSSEGDVGRFIHGLEISAWWVFIPGTIFNTLSLYRILITEIPKSYAVIPIKSLLGRNVFLLVTLCIVFLFIYTHGYNPISDMGINTLTRVLAVFSIILVPILFVLFNPSRSNVKEQITSQIQRLEIEMNKK